MRVEVLDIRILHFFGVWAFGVLGILLAFPTPQNPLPDSLETRVLGYQVSDSPPCGRRIIYEASYFFITLKARVE